VVEIKGEPSENGLNPDYEVRGEVRLRGRGVERFEYYSGHYGARGSGEWFYKKLFEGGEARVKRKSRGMVDSNELRAYLRESLPEYMVPAVYVVMDELPLTPNGKVDPRALPPPGQSRPDTVRYVAPRTHPELVLAGIWAQVLRLDTVGIHDNFFSLGGDSILSIQVVSRATTKGLRLTPRQFFEHQTIAALAAVAGTADALAPEQGPVSGKVVLTPIQRWFFGQELPEPNYFNQAVVLSVPADFDYDRLKQAVAHLLIRHDALRLRFEKGEGGWSQFNAPEEELEVCRKIDLPEVADVREAIEVEARAVHASLDLNQGPLMRVLYFSRGGRNRGRLLWVIHHLAVDAMSWRILLEDLEIAY
ncbi:MAG: condensation domain-containing protein, partial [Blastocatellia bacterium]